MRRCSVVVRSRVCTVCMLSLPPCGFPLCLHPVTHIRWIRDSSFPTGMHVSICLSVLVLTDNWLRRFTCSPPNACWERLQASVKTGMNQVSIYYVFIVHDCWAGVNVTTQLDILLVSHWWSRWWRFYFAKAGAQHCHKCAGSICPTMVWPDFPTHLSWSHHRSQSCAPD